MYTKRYLALVMALVMVFSLVVPVSANVGVTVPTQEATLDCGTETHATSKLTVYVAEQGNSTGSVAAVGTIFSDMSATLQLNYGNYTIDNANITIYGQTHNKANLTTFTLDGHSSTEIVYGTENGAKNYFPGFDQLTKSDGYAIKFVDELGTSSQNWYYTFKKSVDTSGVTLELVVNENETTVTEADARWQALKAEAFTNTDQTSDDSYIKLAAGSYIQLDTEKLTVNGELKLDNFSDSDHVDANVTNAKAKLTYTNNSTTAYQLLLKKGTQFSLGHSIAEVKQDLLVTMSNVTKSYTASILSDVYNKLDTSKEKELAESLLVVFSEIAGLARPADTNPVKIIFGTPNSTTTTEGNTTVITTTTENATGTTDVTTVETTTVTTVETVNEVTTRTEEETVVTTSSTVTENTSTPSQETYTVNYTSQKVVTTTTYQDNEQTNQSAVVADSSSDSVQVIIKEESKNNNVSALSQEDVPVNIADAELNNLTLPAKAALVNEAVTRAQEALQAQENVQSVTVSLAIVATAKNSDAEAQTFKAKTYEVKPVVTTTVEYQNSDSTVVSSNTVSNSNLTGQFQIKLPVPSVIALPGGQVTVTHKSEGKPDEVFENLTVAEDGTVTITVTHFSEFVLEPISAGSSSELTYLKSLSLTSEIAVNFYIGGVTNTDGYSVEYFKTVDGQAGEPVTTPFAALETKVGSDTKTYYYVKLAEFAARQMTDTVTVRVWNGSYMEFENTYSIQGYCNDVIDGNYSVKLKNVCKAILDYGKYSQLYFDYKTDTLANGGSDYFTLPEVPETFAGINEGSAGVIVSLSLKSQVVMNIYVPETETIQSVSVPEGLSYTNNGLVTSNKGAKYTHIQVTGYVARSLDDTVTVTVDGYNYIWSPLGYSRDVQNNSNVKLANVSRAVYNYYLYAVEYFS